VNYRKIKLLTSETTDLVKHNMELSVNKWGLEWFGANGIETQCHVFDMAELTDQKRDEMAGWSGAYSAAEYNADGIAWSYLYIAPEELESMGSWITGRMDKEQEEYRETDIVHQLNLVVIDDLYRRVGSTLYTPTGGTQSSMVSLPDLTNEFRFGSGSIYVEMYLAGIKLIWIFGGELEFKTGNVNSHRATDSRLLQLDHAIENQIVSAQVWLGETELTVEDLGHMEIGDVLRLEKKLDDPLAVEIDNTGTTALHGRICAFENHRSLKLVN
jgi:hypothetical protein